MDRIARFVKHAVISAIVVNIFNAPVCSSAEPAGGTIEVEVINASAPDPESKAVLAAFLNLLKGVEKRSATEIASCLSPDVVMIDESTHKVLFGKDSIMERVKSSVIGSASKTSPVKRFVVDKPFVHVKGDTAMVSFHATKELADVKKTKLESWCAEIYERKEGKWLVLQFKTNWKPARQAP